MNTFVSDVKRADNFSIFGSCVTRDAFGFGAESELVKGYSARSIVASAVSAKVELPNLSDDIETKLNPFEFRMIRNDFSKTWLDVISTPESSSIIIDLIEERFSLVDTGQGLVTESSQFVKAGLGSYYPDATIVSINLRDEIDRKSLLKFSKIVCSLKKKVYIHRALWATSYIENGERSEFEKKDYYARMNRQLVWRYDLLQEIMPSSVAIEIPEEFRVADAGHRWGLAPFHYIPRYYYEFRKALGIE